MAATPQTPRQRMINMIYLVLTAILALNVSNEVLDAFKGVNDSIDISNSSQQSKNGNIYSEFRKQFANDSARTAAAFSKANKARELSKYLYNLLEKHKQQMILEAGGIDRETGKIHCDDDIDVSTRLFVEQGDGKNGKELKRQIETTRKELLALLDETDRNEADHSLALKIDYSNDGRAWEFAKFNHVPVVAAVTLLSKYQSDVLQAEGHVVEKLYGNIYKEVEKVDRFAAKVISPGNFVLQGEQYKADIMVAAYNSTNNPDVFLGSFTNQIKKNTDGSYDKIVSASDVLPLLNPQKIDVNDGIGKLIASGTIVGNKKYTGVVRVKNTTDGKYNFYPFEGEYQVAPKMAVVAPEKMNVLYIGLDNPVDISVPGIAQSDVSAVFEGDGALVKNPDGKYFAHVRSQGTTIVKVSAKINGRLMPMGEQIFRIKRIPNPVTTLDGITQGGKATGTFIKDRVGVVPKADDFVYGTLPWKVQSYVVSIRKSIDFFKVENTSAAFNQKTKDLMKGLKKGDAVFIDDIVVMGPDNKTRTISPIAFDITAQ